MREQSNVLGTHLSPICLLLISQTCCAEICSYPSKIKFMLRDLAITAMKKSTIIFRWSRLLW